MTGHEADRETERKANDLYWGSDVSVNQIAEELDLSKGMLYGLIRPQPAGLACPSCVDEVVYPNRTAKEREMVACPSCGWEGRESDAGHVGGDGAVTLPAPEASAPSVLYGDEGARSRVLIGGALLGAAAGLALVLWARRR